MTQPSVILISRLFPPATGGLSDHTERLASELGRLMPVSVLTSTGARTAAMGVKVSARVTQWHDSAAILNAIQSQSNHSRLLWQYVPHMYGRGGVNFAIPRAMAALRRLGRRQLVIAHEIAAPLSPWPHRLFYALAHRWQWRQILPSVDAIGISTEAWLQSELERKPEYRDKLFLLPSPSLIPVARTPPDHRQQWRRKHNLPANSKILAFFGTLGAAKQFDWIVKAWQSSESPNQPVILVVIGDHPRGSPFVNESPGLLPLGFVSPAVVSEALQATNVLALPFIDGVAERRTSFMAGLSHGCAIVTTIGTSTGATLRSADYLRSQGANDRDAFIGQVRQLLDDEEGQKTLGSKAVRAYRQSYDWPVVCRRLADRLVSPG